MLVANGIGVLLLVVVKRRVPRGKKMVVSFKTAHADETVMRAVGSVGRRKERE